MIRRVPAYVDSEGMFHPTREDACKAEFERMLRAAFPVSTDLELEDLEVIDIKVLVAGLFELDRIVGEAQKEDTRMEFAPVQNTGEESA